jgi:hypothetical protein
MGKVKLDTFTNVAIILFCGIVGAILVQRNFFQAHPPSQPAPIQAGEQSEALRLATPPGANRVLFIALSPRCGYCTESLPFYRRLVAEKVHGAQELSIVGIVASPTDLDAEKALLAEAGIALDHWASVDFAAARVPGTPALVLMNDRGVVAGVWVGKLDSGTEDSVLHRLLEPA